jgi:GMP synthase (glutamine-hydrolysing)
MWAIQYHPEYDLHELARLMHCRSGKLIELGFFQDQADAARYIQRLESLHQAPDRKDLAWQLGIDADVMNPDVRQIEVRNWIDHLVIPNRKN